MYPDQYITIAKKMQGNHAQQGFAIVAAIFLLVVLAALGAFMVTFSTVQHTTAAQDSQGVRAYEAAHAGTEWGAYQILKNPGAGFALACRTPPTSQVLPALAANLANFTVTVGCTATQYDEGSRTAAGANPLWVYRVTSTATSGVVGQTNYIERQIQITIGQ